MPLTSASVNPTTDARMWQRPPTMRHRRGLVSASQGPSCCRCWPVYRRRGSTRTNGVTIRGFNNLCADKLLVLIDGRTLDDRLNAGRPGNRWACRSTRSNASKVDPGAVLAATADGIEIAVHGCRSAGGA